MPQATPLPIRLHIVEFRQKGLTQSQISQRTSVSLSTVKTILRRHRQRGDEGLSPDYDRCGSQQLRSSPFIIRAFVCLRKWHPTYGYDQIFSQIKSKYPDLKLPDRRTVYNWWHRFNLVAKRSKPPKPEADWASKPHQTWQVDAKEEISIANGQKHCWLNVVDEYSGAPLSPPVFPPQ